MHQVLWILQFVLGLFFISNGFLFVTNPAPLAASLGPLFAPYAPWFETFLGGAEIAAGLGLILPGVFKVGSGLTPVAALLLLTVLIGAMVTHTTRGERPQIVFMGLLTILLACMVWGRWRRYPLR